MLHALIGVAWISLFTFCSSGMSIKADSGMQEIETVRLKKWHSFRGHDWRSHWKSRMVSARVSSGLNSYRWRARKFTCIHLHTGVYGYMGSYAHLEEGRQRAVFGRDFEFRIFFRFHLRATEAQKWKPKPGDRARTGFLSQFEGPNPTSSSSFSGASYSGLSFSNSVTLYVHVLFIEERDP